IKELGGIPSAEGLTEWAYQKMTIKNSLTVDDARAVEAAFEARLNERDPHPPEAPSTVAGQASPALAETLEVDEEPESDATCSTPSAVDSDRSQNAGKVESPGNYAGGGIDKCVLTISEPRRYRNKAHLKFVALQACLVCGRQPSDPHLLGFAQPRALGRKV